MAEQARRAEWPTPAPISYVLMFKIMRGLDRVDREKLFPLAERSRTRGHRFKVIGRRTKGDRRKNFFTQRVVRIWNALPERVVEADSIVAFKRELDKYLKENNCRATGKGRGSGIS